MSPQSSQFPIYLKPTLDGTGTRAAFAQFEAAAVASGKAAGNAIRAGVQGGKIDLGITGLTQTIAEAKLAEKALIDIRVAATAKAKQDGDNSTATQQFVQALLKQQYAQTQIIRSGQDELSYYSKLQSALDATSSKQSRLAQLYRETYAEQIKAAQSDLNQRNFTNFAAPGLSGPSRSASDSAAVFAAAFAQSEAKQQAALDRTKQVLLESARASQQYESELRELIAVTNPAALAQEKLAQSIRTADQALARGDLSADAHALAMGRLNTVYGTMAGTMGVTRQATVQAGQQLQDIGISLYSGQQAAVVFAQQIPQLAFVLSSLEGSANKTQDRIGKFATFLAGPWGLLVGAAVGVIGTLIYNFFKTEEAAGKATSAIDKLKNTADYAKNSFDSLVEVMREYNQSLEKSETKTYDAAKAARQLAIDTLKVAEASLAAAEAEQRRGGAGPGQFGGSAALAANATTSNLRDQIKKLQDGLAEAVITKADIEAKRALDPIGAQIEDLKDRADKAKDALRAGTTDEVLLNRELLFVKKEIARLEESRSKRTTTPNRTPQQVFNDFKRELEERGIQQAAGRTGFRSATDQNQIFRSGQSPLDGYQRVSRHQSYQALDPTRASHDDAAARAAAQAAGLKGFKIVSESGGRKHYEWRGAGDAGDVEVAGSERAAQQAEAAAEKERRRLEQLADFGQRAQDSIAGISSRFDEQPRLIDQVASATRDLDAIMADLDQRKPPGFKELIADAQQARVVVQDAINRPLREMEKAAREQGAIDDLRIAGRAAEAELLSRTLDLQRQGAVINRDTVESIADQIAMEQRRSIELEKQNDTLQRNLRLVEGTQDNVRQGIRDLLGGKGFASIGDAFKRQFDLYLDGLADQFSEQLFGDTFRQQKLKLLGLDKVDEAGQEMATTVLSVAQELERLRKAVGITADALSPANDNSVESRFDAAFGGAGSTKAQNDILVNGLRKSAISVERTMTSTLEGFFGRVFGGEAAERITQGMMAAATGGALGGILGGRTGQAIGSGLGGLLGAVSGGQGGIGKLLSGLQSNLPVIGAVLAASQGLNTLLGNDDRKGGGLLHTLLGPIPSLFLGKKSGSTTISSLDGNLAYKGSGGYRDSVLGGGSSVQSSLSRILETLGGTAGNFRVSLGQRGKDFTVDPTGAGRTKGSGVLKFKTEEEAIRAALADALRDGAIAGISAGMQRLIQGGKDLDAQLAKAVKLQDVYDRLKQIDDPLGYAISVVDREFASLRKIATEAGEGMAEVERLYGIERLKVVKETNERITASLRDLYDELTVGNSALSLRDRKSAAQANYNPLADRVRAGDITAYDDYAKAARELLAIERELSGSQSGYFSLLGEVTDLTKARLDASTSPAANDNPAVVFAIGQLGNFIVDGLGAQLTAVNQNLGALIAQGFGSGGGGAGSNYYAERTF